jgi:AcrR family transcriptional regulator
MTARAHTGRQRNEAARRAVLDATRRILREHGVDGLTIEAVARAAQVSRQTIYRWWDSRAAIVAEALAERALTRVPEPHTGSLRDDLRAFLRASYAEAAQPDTRAALRAIVALALADAQGEGQLQAFTAGRRAVLEAILLRHGVAAPQAGPLAEVAYGVLWYRTLIGNAPLDAQAADRIADLLADACGARG